MHDYAWLYQHCLNRFGSAEALEGRLPVPRSPEELLATPDDRYLSWMSLRIFRAGMTHAVVDARWPAFEEVFFGFDPQKLVLIGGEHLERLMQDERLIRHLGKLKSVPQNAQFILDVAREHGRFAALISQWPVEDIVGLWRLLAKRATQLGGLSAPRFLRMVGKDTFIPTEDVVAALKAQGVIDKAPTSQREQAAMQAAFNQWRAESGRPLCQLSVMLAHTVNH